MIKEKKVIINYLANKAANQMIHEKKRKIMQYKIT